MRHTISGAALLLLALVSLGCSSTHSNTMSDTTGGSGGDTGGGETPPPTDTPPNVDGVWRSSTTVTSSNCGSRVPSLSDPRVVNLTQSDTILSAQVFTACGDPIATGSGAMTGSDVSLEFTQELRVSGKCSLRIEVIQTGTLQDGAQPAINGTSRSSLSALGNCGDDFGLPCEVQENLQMERCPPASCTFPGCS